MIHFIFINLCTWGINLVFLYICKNLSRVDSIYSFEITISSPWVLGCKISSRLYFAQSASELVYLNRYITTVSSTTNLPSITEVNVGDFYYVANGNILCTKAFANADSWTQINPPDTNTDTSLTGASFKALPKDGNIEVSYTLN